MSSPSPPADAPVRAVFLDLFETVVTLRADRLPLSRVGDRRFPSTIPFLMPYLRAELDDVTEGRVGWALGQMYRELREAADGNHREVHSAIRFARLAERLGAGRDRAFALGSLLADEHMRHLTGIADFPEGNEAALDELAARVPLALVSNFDHGDWGRRLADRLGLQRWFQEIVFSDDLGLRKPHRALFDTPLERLDLAAADVLFVGDTPEADVAGAAAVGMRCAWIQNGDKEFPEGLAEATLTIHHLRELVPWVEARLEASSS